MKCNQLLNNNASILRETMSDARNLLVLSDEGATELAAVAMTLSALSTVKEPLRATCRFAALVTEEISEELAECIRLGECSLPIQWCPATSYGIDMFRALKNLILAEILARRFGLDLTFNDLEFEVYVRLDNCECHEPCSEIFNLLDDSRELLEFMQEWPYQGIAPSENLPEEKRRGSGKVC